MTPCRLHITGASGAGTTTLGRAVATAWAGGYEDREFDGRNRGQHEQWLATLTCPVLRLDSARPVDELVAAIVSFDEDASVHRRRGDQTAR